MSIIKNSSPIPQAVIFVLVWTLFWSLLILLWPPAESFSAIEGIADMSREAAHRPAAAHHHSAPLILSLSLCGSLINYYLVHCLTRLTAKRTVLSIFWVFFWIAYVIFRTLLIDTSPFLNRHSTGDISKDNVMDFLSLFGILVEVFMVLIQSLVLAPKIALISYFASFIPPLEPKNHKGFLL
jgi:hypothetical protein